MLDDSWYVDCDLGTAMGRVYARQTRNGTLPEVARRRVEDNDRPNGEAVERSKRRAALVVPSLPLRAELAAGEPA